MAQHPDLEVIKYFKKILTSVTWILIWMIACATAGIYLEFGHTTGKPIFQPIIFYTAMTISLLFLIRFLNKVWKK